MAKLASLLRIAAFIGASKALNQREFTASEPELKETLCVNCRSPKRHNNAYCSAACCKEHRAKNHEPK